MLSFFTFSAWRAWERSVRVWKITESFIRNLAESPYNVLESLDEEVNVQIDGVAGNELEVSLIAEMGTESVAVLFLFGNKGSLGLRALAELVTASQKHGNSASRNNHFCLHKESSFKIDISKIAKTAVI
jgi:hypothetical protein